jgi:hypothetical protein
MKIMNHLKNMNIHISQKYMYLIAIVVGAIVLFSLLKGPREGFNNYISTGDNTEQQDDDADKQSKKCKPSKKNHKNRSSNNGSLGIPRSQIPDGDEDLYILKTAVIPPVCPACPNVTACTSNSNKPPPPCPPCARCPEPAFDCKKVPNYNSNSNEFLPRPVLADFSQFGM